MKQAVRAIVVKGEAENRSLLVMYRNKFGTEYYTLVGGGVEIGESLDQALIRELAEETSVQVANPRLVYVEETEEIYGTQYVYLCEYVSGEPHLSPQSDEAKINELGQNLYEPKWLPLAQLPEVPFVSEGLKARILQAVGRRAWPEQPEQFYYTQTILE
jgi:ADP-ribose pyrophosphatase YjhB (NUDIX family)